MIKHIRQHLREAFESTVDASTIEIDVRVINNLLVFLPFYDGERMGAFRLVPYNADYKVYEVLLYDRFKGYGIGFDIYKYIIEELSSEGKRLYSDDNQSPEAYQIWTKLVKSGLATKLSDKTFVSTL